MDYISITNYNRLGEMGISRNAIRSIAAASVENVAGAKVLSADSKRIRRKKNPLFSVPSGVKVTISKDGSADIKLDVVVAPGSNASEIAKNIQKEIADAIAMMCESLTYEVTIKIAKVQAL